MAEATRGDGGSLPQWPHIAGLKVGRDLFTSGQVAKLLGVAPRTVSKWVDAGRLGGYRLPGSDDRRVRREDLVAFAKVHGLRLPAWLTGAGRVCAALSDPVPGVEAVGAFELAVLVGKGEVLSVLVGCAEGLAAAVALARAVRAADASARLGLVLADDVPAAAVPPGVFDRVFGADDRGEAPTWAAEPPAGREGWRKRRKGE